MTVVRMLGKGQVVIPKAIRHDLGIKPGTRLMLQVKDRRIEMLPLPDDPIKALRGILKETGPSTVDLLRWRREERRRETSESA